MIVLHDKMMMKWIWYDGDDHGSYDYYNDDDDDDGDDHDSYDDDSDDDDEHHDDNLRWVDDIGDDDGSDHDYDDDDGRRNEKRCITLNIDIIRVHIQHKSYQIIQL